jgi:hypothetical protein
MLQYYQNRGSFNFARKEMQSACGRCENRNAGISRNMAEYHGISLHFPGIYRNITIFSDGSHATVYKHGRLTTYVITKVMDLSHFDGK